MKKLILFLLSLLPALAQACTPQSVFGAGDSSYVAASLHLFAKVIPPATLPSIGAYWRCAGGEWDEVHAVSSAQLVPLPSMTVIAKNYPAYVQQLLHTGTSCFAATAPPTNKTPVVNSALFVGANKELLQFCFAMVQDTIQTYAAGKTVQ